MGDLLERFGGKEPFVRYLARQLEPFPSVGGSNRWNLGEL